MIRELETKTLLSNKANSQKKITKYDDSIQTILEVIEYVNSLDEFAQSIWIGHSISDVTFPTELSDFVMPASVRYDSNNLKTKDLLDRPVHIEFNISYLDYVQACDRFRSNFKRDAVSDMTPFDNVRRHVNLNDIIDRISVNGQVSAKNNPFVPIRVVGVENLFEDRYFNDTEDSVLRDYIAEIKFI